MNVNFISSYQFKMPIVFNCKTRAVFYFSEKVHSQHMQATGF